MNELFAQTGDVSPITLAGLLLGCISILAGVIAKMWSMFISDKEKTTAAFVKHNEVQEAKFAETVERIGEKHDATLKELDERWREERDRDRSRADNREAQMAEAFARLTDKLPDVKG